MKQRHPDKVFNFTNPVVGSKRRRELSVEELVSNLRKLIEHAYTLPMQQPADSPLLVGKRIQHKFNEDGSEKTYIGKVISQVFDRIKNWSRYFIFQRLYLSLIKTIQCL